MKPNNLYKVYCDLYILLKLYLTIPLSNAPAERSFRAPKRVKTEDIPSKSFDIGTSQSINHYLILHTHKKVADNINLETVGFETW